MQKIVPSPDEPGGSGTLQRGEAGSAGAVRRTGGLSDSQRYHAMDALRASMMLLGVVFHASLPYITFRRMTWFFDPSQEFALDLVAIFTHSFRMPVFFMAAGFFAALLYDKRGLGHMARNRLQRVVLPFIIGWLILAPLCVASMRFGMKVADSGSLETGWAWLQTGKWLKWGGIFHLWFLVGLMVLYPGGLGVRWLILRLRGSHLAALRAGARWFLVNPWRPIILVLPVAAMMVPIQFGRSDTFTFYPVFWFSTFFALGWVIYTQADLLPQMGRNAWAYVAVAVAVLPIVAVAHRAASRASDVSQAVLPNIVVGTGGAFICVFMVFGTLGLVLTYFNRPSPLARYLADSSYWVYLVHLPLVLFLGALLSVLPLPAVAKWALTLAIAVPILFVSYHYLVRFTPIGTLLNGRRYRIERPALATS